MPRAPITTGGHIISVMEITNSNTTDNTTEWNDETEQFNCKRINNEYNLYSPVGVSLADYGWDGARDHTMDTGSTRAFVSSSVDTITGKAFS